MKRLFHKKKHWWKKSLIWTNSLSKLECFIRKKVNLNLRHFSWKTQLLIWIPWIQDWRMNSNKKRIKLSDQSFWNVYFLVLSDLNWSEETTLDKIAWTLAEKHSLSKCQRGVRQSNKEIIIFKIKNTKIKGIKVKIKAWFWEKTTVNVQIVRPTDVISITRVRASWINGLDEVSARIRSDKISYYEKIRNINSCPVNK